MISVPIDRIVPLTDARDNFSRLINDIETLSDGLYVLTKGGKPAIALINIKYLEEIMEGRIGENHELRITKHESDHKPEASHKVSEPIHRPAPVKLPEPPNPPAGGANLPKPNFEVPRITTPAEPLASSSLATNQDPFSFAPVPKPAASSQSPVASLPDASYDVKPTVNPTWTGEEVKKQPPAPSSLASSQNPIPTAPPFKPEAITPSTVLGVNQSPVPSSQAPIPPPTPTKPPINPWPIIPPRAPSEQGIRDTSTIPPRQAPPPEPLASSSLSPSQNPPSVAPPPKPVASPPASSQLPDASYPKMVAPPPPPPPSSLPRIPSSFQTVPVPINGNKEQLAPSQNQNSPLSVPKPEASSQMPGASLPPPPITTAPAPFANSPNGKPLAPSQNQNPPLSVPKPEVSSQMPEAPDSIAFDQPPTTIPEPGEDLPEKPLATSQKPEASSPSTQLGVNGANPTPATPPPSVKDLEI